MKYSLYEISIALNNNDKLISIKYIRNSVIFKTNLLNYKFDYYNSFYISIDLVIRELIWKLRFGNHI